MRKKWYPLPWQESIWQSIIQQELTDRLAHAFLFRGVQGVGKFHFARALAAQLLCETPGAEYACGQCKECALVKAGTHPDLLMITPETEGRHIKIDQVRQVNDFARKTAQQGGRRVVVMSPAEAMNINAANALLKSLEEPGSNTVFLLVSDRAGDMLPTIRSRCQLITFPAPSREIAAQWLSEHVADQVLVNQLLNLTGNSPVSARTMFDENTLEVRGKLINSVAGLFRGEITPVELAREWQGSDLPLLLGWLGSWLDDIVRISMTGSDQGIRNEDLTKMLSYLAGKSPAKNVVRLRDETYELRQQLQEGANLNAQIMLEGIFSKYLELVI